MSEQDIVTASESVLRARPTASLVRGMLRDVPFRVSAIVRLHGLRLNDLHYLHPGQVLTTETSATEDVPVVVGASAFAFAELDNVDGQMALRLTRLV